MGYWELANVIEKMLSSLTGHGDQGKFLISVKMQMLHTSLRRARRKIWGNSDWSASSASHHTWEDYEGNPPKSPVQGREGQEFD